MKKIYAILLILIGIAISSLLVWNYLLKDKIPAENTPKYAGQETRLIKSLSPEDIESLEKGTGDAFGGLAKLAELNGYPGPRHVLDLAIQLNLTAEQKSKIENINNQRTQETQALGKEIIALEKEMNDEFANKTITREILWQKLEQNAELYGKLRFAHLQYHLAMMDILTPEQVARYSDLRGYTSTSDPCKNIPEGMDQEMWKQHNNCK